MYQKTRAVFVYCLSPIHMGAGTALGLIDNPIQRERHTDYPVLAGSGLKGAIREFYERSGAPKVEVARIFGPGSEDSEDHRHAGSVSFSDAQIVAFPVRSARSAFVYATSPTALARTQRLLQIGGTAASWSIPAPAAGQCVALATESTLALEMFEFTNLAQQRSQVRQIADDLASLALPDAPDWKFFRDRIREQLVILSDEDFGFFVRHSTLVEPHVRINDISGAADEGGLFYTENLPPESILVATLMSTGERHAREDDYKPITAEQIISRFEIGDGDKWPSLCDREVLVGGDVTTGRGQAFLHLATEAGQ